MLHARGGRIPKSWVPVWESGLPDEQGMGKTRSETGQALIETAISILLFLGVTLALVTFGHAFMVVNMITHAARDGARLAATWPYRGGCNAITNYDSIKSTVKAEIGTVTGGSFQVNVDQVPSQNGLTPPNCVNSTTPQVKVTVTGCVPYIFPILPSNLGQDCNGQKGFTVNRVAYFHDEGVRPN